MSAASTESPRPCNYGWRDRILEAGREALVGKEERSGERELRRKIGELERALGRKTYELERLSQKRPYWSAGAVCTPRFVRRRCGSEH